MTVICEKRLTGKKKNNRFPGVHPTLSKADMSRPACYILVITGTRSRGGFEDFVLSCQALQSGTQRL